jgi:hypothetical protein
MEIARGLFKRMFTADLYVGLQEFGYWKQWFSDSGKWTTAGPLILGSVYVGQFICLLGGCNLVGLSARAMFPFLASARKDSWDRRFLNMSCFTMDAKECFFQVLNYNFFPFSNSLCWFSPFFLRDFSKFFSCDYFLYKPSSTRDLWFITSYALVHRKTNVGFVLVPHKNINF